MSAISVPYKIKGSVVVKILWVQTE